MEVNCPKCFNDNAYFDGIKYSCPDCDYEWGVKNQSTSKKQNDIDEKYYNCFVKTEKGLKYSCKNISKSEIKNITIIPLAKDFDLYTQYILLEANPIEKTSPEIFNKLLLMNFKELENFLKKLEISNIKNNILLVRTGPINTYLDYYDSNNKFVELIKIDE
jgi:hypothetical protein